MTTARKTPRNPLIMLKTGLRTASPLGPVNRRPRLVARSAKGQAPLRVRAEEPGPHSGPAPAPVSARLRSTDDGRLRSTDDGRRENSAQTLDKAQNRLGNGALPGRQGRLAWSARRRAGRALQDQHAPANLATEAFPGAVVARSWQSRPTGRPLPPICPSYQISAQPFDNAKNRSQNGEPDRSYPSLPASRPRPRKPVASR